MSRAGTWLKMAGAYELPLLETPAISIMIHQDDTITDCFTRLEP